MEYLCKAEEEIRAAIFGPASGTTFEGKFGLPSVTEARLSLNAIAIRYKKHGINCEELAAIVHSAKSAHIARKYPKTPAHKVALQIQVAASFNGSSTRNDDAAIEIGQAIIEAHLRNEQYFLTKVQDHLTNTRRKNVEIPGWQFTVVAWWCPKVRIFSYETSRCIAYWPGFAFFKPDAMLRYLWASNDDRITSDALRGFIRTRNLLRASKPLIDRWPN